MALASASAPGKVLICGGYLIVESPHVGLSISVSSRFTTNLLQMTDQPEDFSLLLKVLSPQFGAEFLFRVTLSDRIVSVTQVNGPKSPFLFNAVLFSCSAAALHNPSLFGSCFGKELVLQLLASNDFYSQRNYLESIGKPVTAATLREVPPHNPLMGEISKTGLGSSAALTTSLVGCLLHFFGCTSNVELVHRVAQVAHSVAQGKIGSGFDVYTACYGTCVYRRFPSARVEMMMADKASQPNRIELSVFDKCLDLEQPWVERIPFSGLPKGVTLMLADIHQGGSSTPGMVSKVMAWRKTLSNVPDNLWNRLSESNLEYIDVLKRMCALEDNTQYTEALDDAAQSKFVRGKNIVLDTVVEMRGKAALCRSLLRELGKITDVDIEPLMLTKLLDATLEIPGVLAVGCPGAGGFDAVFALVVARNCSLVEAMWEHYEALHVCPLLVRENPQGLELSKN